MHPYILSQLVVDHVQELTAGAVRQRSRHQRSRPARPAAGAGDHLFKREWRVLRRVLSAR
jgi:hypothetical protein